MLRFIGPLILIVPMVFMATGCGTQIAVTGEARERLVNPLPYGARWVKEGMTRESRLADWVACGGGRDLQTGFRSSSSNESWADYELQRVPFIRRQTECMQSKGYEFKFHSRPGLPDQCDARCLYP